ncbi:vegetative cell wall protein gp1-like [Iris pallida]|uniref:Vegetative cell wall protein gp1-like n=1 Tax=Iris pallida TaxID=29817 RepID=A0AAX6I660_IRIPA|nr:vegetative cell wall protein gp1-like [Iris pallida]
MFGLDTVVLRGRRVTPGMVAVPEAVASGEVRLGRYMDFFCILFCFVSSVGHRILCTGNQNGVVDTGHAALDPTDTAHILCIG